MSIGEQIKHTRESQGMTQLQLGEALGLVGNGRQTSVARLEGDNDYTPSIPMLDRVCKALGCVLLIEIVEGVR